MEPKTAQTMSDKALKHEEPVSTMTASDCTDILFRFPADVFCSMCQYLSVYDLGYLQLVNRYWRDFLRGKESENCWSQTLSVPSLGKKEWDILVRNGQMKRGASTGSDDVGNGGDTNMSSANREANEESDSSWVRLKDRDVRGDVALFMPASCALTAWRGSYWRVMDRIILCRQLGLFWFDSMVTFRNVPEGNYIASIKFLIRSEWYQKVAAPEHGGKGTRRRRRFSIDLSHVAQHIEVGDLCRTTGELQNPSYEDYTARVLLNALSMRPPPGSEYAAIRIDTPGVKVVKAGSSVSIRLRDTSNYTMKAGVAICHFELVRLPRYKAMETTENLRQGARTCYADAC